MQHGEDGQEVFLLVPFADMFFFAVLFALAVLSRKRLEWHRRLMLLASVSLTVAAFARFPDVVVPKGYFNVACDAMIFIAVVRDLLVERRVHPVYLFGLPLLIVGQVTTEVVRHTSWWVNIASDILN